MNEGWKKRRTNEEKERNADKKLRGCNMSKWNKFCLVTYLS